MKLSIITPTVDLPVGSGRAPSYLKSALQSVLDAGHDDFEVLIGCDGDVPAIKAMVESFKEPRFRYIPCKFTGHWGNPQRNQLQKIAKGKYVTYLDHDDVFVPGALKEVMADAEVFQNRLLVYKLRNIHLQERWVNRGEVKPLFIGGQMMVAPNDELLPEWLPEDYYSADLNFCTSIVDNHIKAGRPPVWIPFVIQHLRPWSISTMVEYRDGLDALRSGISNDS